MYNVRPPFTIAKLVNITPITMVYGTYNYSFLGFINQLTSLGGPTLYCYIYIYIYQWTIYIYISGLYIYILPDIADNLCDIAYIYMSLSSPYIYLLYLLWILTVEERHISS